MGRWPNWAAMWRGVLPKLSGMWSAVTGNLFWWSLLSSVIEVYFVSVEVRNSTTAWEPPTQALCSGVFPYSSSHSRSIFRSVTRYLTISRWPSWLAKWRGVRPSGPGVAGLQFFSVMKYWSISKLPAFAATCRAVESLSSLNIGLSCFSTKNFTVCICPFNAVAQKSKVDVASTRPCTLSS